jgi:hypothetical protein
MKSTKAIYSLILLISFLIGPNVYADNATRATQLLSYFKSGCSMEGEWTSIAVSQAQALIESLKSIEEDEDCKSTAGVISNLNQMNGFLETIQQNPNEREIFGLQNLEQTLLLALNAATEPTEISVIASELRAIQGELAVLEGYQTFDGDSNSLTATETALSSVLGSTSSVFKTLEANQACWSKYPGVLSSAATMAGSIASGFSSAGYAIIVKAAVDLIGQVVNYSRKWNIKLQINKSAHPIASLAFQCATEKIADNWCGAEDARKAVVLKERTLSQDFSHDNIWVGVRILDKELPKLLKWLTEVRAGAEPSTQADADRQNRVLWRETSIRTAKNKVKGILNESEQLFQTASGRDAKWSILRTILIQITDNLKNSGILTEIYSAAYAPYYLLGISKEDAPKIEGDYQSIISWEPSSTIKFDLKTVNAKFDAWTDKAQITVQNELNLVLQVDALGVINNAIDNQGIPRRVTPMSALKRIKIFLANNIPTNFQTASHKMIYQDTILTLEKIINNINSVFATTDSISPATALININNIAKLTFGNIFVKNRILRSVRFSLNDIVIQRRNDGDSLASQLLAAEDIINSLNKYSPSGAMNLTAIRHQIAQAQSMSQQTLRSFTKYYGRKIKNTLKKYDVLAQRAGEDRFGSNNTAKAALCLKLLSVDVWPSKIPFKLCRGMMLKHPNPKGPKVEITEKLRDLEFSKRACLYRDYLRKSLIFDRSRIIINK